MKAIILLLLVLAPFLSSLDFTIALEKKKNDGNLNLCPTCIDTMQDALSGLLEIILQVGVLGSCGELCSLLPGSKILKEACNILCDYVGVEAFAALIKKADLDPIWICQEMKLCQIGDCTLGECGKMINEIARPPVVYEEETVQIEFDFDVLTEIKTPGMLLLDIECPFGSTPASLSGGSYAYQGFEQQRYNVGMKLMMDTTKYDFEFGTFKVHFTVCQGQCGSKHEHTRLIVMGNTQFNYTH